MPIADEADTFIRGSVPAGNANEFSLQRINKEHRICRDVDPSQIGDIPEIRLREIWGLQFFDFGKKLI